MATASASNFFVVFSDLLQLYALHTETNTLRVEGPNRRIGRLELRSGRLLHASLGEQRGREAFFEMMRWPRGKLVERTFESCGDANVDEKLSELLMEAYWKLEQLGTSEAAAPDTLEEPTNQLDDDEMERYLLWGDRLSEALGEVPELTSYNVLNWRGDVLVQNRTDATQPDTSDIPREVLRALAQLEAAHQDYELMLTAKGNHHVLLGIHGRLRGIFHCVYEADTLKLAMAHWKTRQFAEKHLPLN